MKKSTPEMKKTWSPPAYLRSAAPARSTDGIIFRRGAKVTVNSRPGMCFNVDAELIGNEPADFEMLSRMLQFVLAAP